MKPVTPTGTPPSAYQGEPAGGGWRTGGITNPVIPGFHPDPSICRVGDDYFLACSSFEYFPGIPLFHSRDLVHWEQVGNVLHRPLPTAMPASAGVYAPTLRYHGGRFWLITLIAGGGGTVLFSATDPAGPWSEPVPVPGVTGIDPDLAWDEQGRCYCTYAGIAQVRIDLETGRTLDEPCRLWSGTPDALCPEAPHLYRIGDYWYLMIAEGGTERGHGVSIARGPAPYGPFVPCPSNPILSHRSTARPIQNTGHGDLVEAPDGSWWMVLLGVRPQGGTPGWHVLGRETYLVPVVWRDGWPVVGDLLPDMPAPPWPARPVAEAPVREDFDEPDLHPRWISVRDRPAAAVSTKDRPGWLTLHARGATLDESDVVFVGRRQQHLSCRVRALVDASQGRGGVAVMLDERHHYAIEVSGGEVRVIARIGPASPVVAARPVPDGPVVLRIEVLPAISGAGPTQGPDRILLAVEDPDGGHTILADLDGRYLSTEVAGGFTGRVIGVYAGAGTVHADWFDYQPLDQPVEQ